MVIRPLSAVAATVVGGCGELERQAAVVGVGGDGLRPQPHGARCARCRTTTRTSPDRSARSTDPLSVPMSTGLLMPEMSTEPSPLRDGQRHVAGHGHLVVDAAPVRAEVRARAVQLQRVADDLAGVAGLAQPVADLGDDVDAVGVGAGDGDRAGGAVDVERRQAGGRERLLLGVLLVGQQRDDLVRPPRQRAEDQDRREQLPQEANAGRRAARRRRSDGPGGGSGAAGPVGCESSRFVIVIPSPIAGPPARGGGRLRPVAGRAS